MTDLFPADSEDEGLPADFNQSVTMKLLQALVESGVLKADKAQALLQQAENEALAARKTEKDRKAAAAAEEDDAMRVSYVPESVRQQIKDEVRNQIIDELKTGGATSLLHFPLPEPDHKFGGDIRLRLERITMPEGNDNTGAFPNFNAINTREPFDTAGVLFSPQINSDQDRNRIRLRMRFGGEFALEDGWLAGIRIATGQDNSPITVNQTLGVTGNGQGGNFSKYAIWLDRAFFRYQAEGSKGSAAVYGGRFDNPFQSTQIIFDDDLGFDGGALKFKAAGSKVMPWLTAGAFPIFNTDLNFAHNRPAKFKSIDKDLLGGQLGADFKIGSKVGAKLSGAYYDFRNVEGRPSTPFLPLGPDDAGDTDHSRPSFAQKGNTYRPIRTIIPDPLNNFGTTNQWQYFGLASQFRPVSANARIDFNQLEPVQISLIGEYIKNTAFNREEIEAVAVNNRGPLPTDPATGAAAGTGSYEGSDTAWTVGLKMGHPALDKRGKWQLGLDYRWVGSDAVVDGFVDSVFGGGGTNMKGVALSGRIALSKNASVVLSWLSADNIAGPPFRTDFAQIDFTVRF